MNSADIIALDVGCRGAAVGLSLLIAATLLRDRPKSAAVRLTAALAICAIAYAIREAPSFPRPWPRWALPFAAVGWGSPAVFWLWAQATFDDQFRLRRWHAALWVALVGLGLLAFRGGAIGAPLAIACERIRALAEFVLVLLAIGQTLATWRSDLVAGRRRLRIVNLMGVFAYFAASALAGLSITPQVSGSSMGSLIDALGLCVLAMFYSWTLLQGAGGNKGDRPVAALGDGPEETKPTISSGEGRRSAVEPALLRRLEGVMTVERAYRQEGLTSGVLAGKLGLPEYRLRQLINEGLGHRNFNAFLNRYRIEEAKAALADPTQKDVPIVTIAMDCGFKSLGPFNRAFKVDTGQTPSEFRRLGLGIAPAKPLDELRNFEIGEPR